MWFVKSQSKEFAHKQKAKCLWNSFPAKWSRIIILEKYHYWRINANLLRFRIEPLVFSQKEGWVHVLDRYLLFWCRSPELWLGLGENRDKWGHPTHPVQSRPRKKLSNTGCSFLLPVAGFVKLWHCSQLPDCWAIWAVDKESPFMECVGSICALPK